MHFSGRILAGSGRILKLFHCIADFFSDFAEHLRFFNGQLFLRVQITLANGDLDERNP